MTSRDSLLELQQRIGKTVLGQEKMIERMLIGLLANGNLLVEGLPGLAKTRAIKKLANLSTRAFHALNSLLTCFLLTLPARKSITPLPGRANFSFSPGPSLTIWCWPMK